ncbi:MAG: methionine adenosyltransferase domain-containing protein, partial [Halieaceae bacterium]
SISLNTFGTNQVDEAVIVRLVRDHFDLRPKGIIEMLDLKKPIYRKTASYGHFGRDDQDFPWELTDRAEELRKAV